MKRIILLTGMLCLILTHEGLAQNEKTNQIGIHWGIGYLQKQDINFSPFIHTDVSVFIPGISYVHTDRIYQRVYARFGWYKSMVGDSFTYLDNHSITGEETVFETIPHNFNILDLDYSLGIRAFSNSQSELVVGPKVRNLLNQGNFEYGPSGIGYYYFTFGLDFWARYQYRVGDDHLLNAELSLPVLAWVARSPYLGQDSNYINNSSPLSSLAIVGNYIKDGELQSWGKFQRVDLKLGYTYEVNSRLNLQADYNLNFNKTDVPSGYTSIENYLLIGAILKL